MNYLFQKVLVGAPVNQNKEYCRERYIETVKSLTYPYYDVYCCDNSADNQYHARNFVMCGINCDWVNPHGKRNVQYVLESQQAVVNKALTGNYDYLLFLEEDIVPPSNIIEQLISYNKPFVTARYFVRSGTDSQLLEMEIEDVMFTTYTNRMVWQTESFLDFGTDKKKFGMYGIGCALISMEVLQKIPLTVIEGENSHADTPLYFQLYESGIPVTVHQLIVQHNNSNWLNVKDYYA